MTRQKPGPIWLYRTDPVVSRDMARKKFSLDFHPPTVDVGTVVFFTCLVLCPLLWVFLPFPSPANGLSGVVIVFALYLQVHLGLLFGFLSGGYAFIVELPLGLIDSNRELQRIRRLAREVPLLMSCDPEHTGMVLELLYRVSAYHDVDTVIRAGAIAVNMDSTEIEVLLAFKSWDGDKIMVALVSKEGNPGVPLEWLLAASGLIPSGCDST